MLLFDGMCFLVLLEMVTQGSRYNARSLAKSGFQLVILYLLIYDSGHKTSRQSFVFRGLRFNFMQESSCIESASYLVDTG